MDSVEEWINPPELYYYIVFTKFVLQIYPIQPWSNIDL